MNWKLVATLIVGAVLVSACGSAQQEPASPTGINRGPEEESATHEAGGNGAAANSPAPGVAPAAAEPAKDVAAPAAKQGIVVHD